MRRCDCEKSVERVLQLSWNSEWGVSVYILRKLTVSLCLCAAANHVAKCMWLQLDIVRQAGRQTGRQASQQTGRQAGQQTGRQANRQKHKRINRKADGQAGSLIEKQSGRQVCRQADRQTDRQAGRHTGRQTNRLNLSLQAEP